MAQVVVLSAGGGGVEWRSELLLHNIWADPRAIPLYISFASILLVGIRFASSHIKEHPSDSANSANQYDKAPLVKRNKNVRQVIEFVRTLGSFFLVGLAAAITTKSGSSAADWFICAVFLYAALLSSIVSLDLTWLPQEPNHVSLIHFSVLAVFTVTNLAPLAIPGLPLEASHDPLFWVMYSILTLTGLVIPLAIPKPLRPRDHEHASAFNPSETASWLSTITYSYLDSLVRTAYGKSNLAIDDLPVLLENEKAEYLSENVIPGLDPLLIGTGTFRLFKGLCYTFRKDIAGMILAMTVETINSFAAPIATLKILGFLEADEADRSHLTKPWIWIIWLVFGTIATSLCAQAMLWYTTHVMVRMEAFFSEMIFAHSLRVRLNTASPELKKDGDTKGDSGATSRATSGTSSPDNVTEVDAMVTNGSDLLGTQVIESATEESIGTSTILESQGDAKKEKEESKDKGSSQSGAISNLLTVDLKNITEAFDLNVVYGVIKLSLTFVLLYQILGWSSFVGVAVLVLSLPVPTYLAKLRTSVQVNQMQKSDERLQIVTQTMNVVRMIKLFGWESQMEEKIRKKRQSELNYIWWGEVMDNASYILVKWFPLGAMIGTISCYTLVMKQPLKASVLFSSVTLFNGMEQQMQELFWVLPRYVKGKVSLDRVATFMGTGEYLETPGADQQRVGLLASPTVEIYDATFSWKTEHYKGDITPRTARRTRNFRLRVQGKLTFVDGKLNLITGPTGSGKTSLLMSLLGEMVYRPEYDHSYYSFPRDGGIAYAAQESWVLNETIKNNILFGLPYDEVRYKKVLHQCALEKDLDMFEAGDATEVGEKGITLSGGQKARITLARAVYSSAKMVLLDDILSALDVHTSRWIVDKCLGGDILAGRTVLLVTHNVLLTKSMADYIVVLDLDGKIRHKGHPEEVLEQDSYLQKEALQEMKAAQTADEKGKDEVIEEQTNASAGKLIVAEEMAEGRVGWPAFKMYLNAMGSLAFFIGAYLVLLICTFIPVMQKAFLGYWSSRYDDQPTDDVPVKLYLAIYAVITMTGSLFFTASWFVYLIGTFRASARLHKELMISVMSSTLRWLDTTPISRVLTRCSQDIEAIDTRISQFLHASVHLATEISVHAVAVCVAAGWEMVFPAVIVMAFGLTIGRIYMTAQLPVKRLQSNAKAPVLGHVQSVLAGLVSVRAYSAQASSIQKLRERIDTYSKITHPFWDLNRWIAVRIESAAALFSGVIAVWLVYLRPGASSSTVGFSLAVISTLNLELLFLVRLYNYLEVQSNSLERVRDFLLIEHEAPFREDGQPPAAWPTSGELRVDGLTARYSRESPEVLKNISFDVKSGERVGVVGRTGAGKSTLALALLRAIPTSGTVLFDGLKTSQINLQSLRTHISIIPQSPELLQGSLRENLDPLGEHDDAILNSALQSAGLGHLRTLAKTGDEGEENEITLDTHVEENGSNFSLGQRQIIALARALVRRSRILIMDEATAAIDHETDQAIQQFIRTQFNDVTIITVAHRLGTIMDSDKIMVLDQGELVEFGSPNELLKTKGLFRSLVDESSDRKQLYAIAGSNSVV